MNKPTFTALYEKIHKCRACVSVMHDGVPRKVTCGQSDLLLVMEAPSSTHVWRSGVQCFDVNGKTGSTGKNLETFLNRIGYTIYPALETTLNSGVVIKPKAGFKTAYISDCVMCWPGYKNPKLEKGNRTPTNSECNNCLSQGYLKSEIEIIVPKVAILIGEKAQIIANEMRIKSRILNDLVYFEIPHPSGSNGAKWSPFIKNCTLIAEIKAALFSQQGDAPEPPSAAR